MDVRCVLEYRYLHALLTATVVRQSLNFGTCNNTDSYQKALHFAKRKTNSDTDTSCSQLGKGKRRRKHKQSQDVSDNSDSDPLRMTPPPSIPISYDIQTDPCDELLHDEAVPILLSQELNNDLSIQKEEQNYNKINTEKDIATFEEEGDFNNNNGTSTAIVEEVDKEVQQKNIAAVMTNRDENLTDSQDVKLKILQNVLATRRMIEQQNEFLKQLDPRINISIASNAAAARNPNMTNIPTKPFNKYRKLLEFDDGLRGNIAASKELEMFLYLLGGNTGQVLSRNGLEKLFINKLGSKCSWFGRKGNYKLSSLRTMEILKSAIRKHFPLYTNQNFQDHVSAWFKYAKTR